MASTYSSLKIELIGTGDQAGTWGNTTNTNLGTAIEEAITGTANVTFASSNAAIELTNTNAAQTARNLRLNLVGTITNVQTLFVPAVEKQYLVTNGLSNSVIISNGSNASPTGTTFTLPSGKSSILFNDGTNVVDVLNAFTSAILGAANAGSIIPFYFANQAAFPSATTYHGAIAHSHADGAMYFAHSGSWVRMLDNGGPLGTPSSGNLTNATNLPISTGVSGLGANVATFLASPSSANLALAVTDDTGSGSLVFATAPTISNATLISSQINAYTEGITTGYVNTGSTFTLNIANSTIITANLNATCTFTMPSNTAGKSFVLFLKTGAGTNTATFTGVKFVGNSAPTITATANRMDILTFTADGANWYGNYAQGFVP